MEIKNIVSFQTLFIAHESDRSELECFGCFVANQSTHDISEYMLTGIVKNHSDGVQIVRMFDRAFDTENRMEEEELRDYYCSENYNSCGVNLVPFSRSGLRQTDLDYYKISPAKINQETYALIIGASEKNLHKLRYLRELVLPDGLITADKVALSRSQARKGL